MKPENISLALNHIDDSFIEAADVLRSREEPSILWKHRTALAACLCLLLIIGSGLLVYLNNSLNTPRYNTDPDISEKIVGSRNSLASRAMPVIFDDVFAEATVVIVGTVIAETEEPTELDMFSITGTIYHTIVDMDVLETIAGDPPANNTIKYRQIGRSGNDFGQTKVENGITYVLILKYFELIDQYMATAFEESVFLVNEDNSLLSLSDQLFCARYDGIQLSVLIEDIEAIWYD